MGKRRKKLKAAAQSPEPLEVPEPAAASEPGKNSAPASENLGSDVEGLDMEFSKPVSF